jgi:hypothetical protein
MLARLHDLSPLIDEFNEFSDQAHIGLALAFALVDDFPASPDRIANLDGRFEIPLIPSDGCDTGALGIVGAPHQALRDGKTEKAVRDAGAELRLLAELFIRMNLAVIACETRKVIQV